MLKCPAFLMRQGAKRMDHKAVNKQRIAGAIGQGLLAGVILSAVFAAGYLIRGQVPVTAQEKADQPFALLGEVNTLIESNYLRELPSDTSMEYGAIRGYLAELNDPYTFLQ